MRCGGCTHAEHKGGCRGKAPSGCVPLLDASGDRVIGTACGSRPRCPCAWRTCRCGALVDTCSMGEWAVPVLRGSAGKPDGRLAVRLLPDGTLRCRELANGENPGEREWRGVEHTCVYEPADPGVPAAPAYTSRVR